MAIHRPPQPGLHRSPLRFVVPPLLVMAAIVGTLLFGDPEAAPELDADLCSTSADDIVHRAVLLLDLRKPLTAVASSRSLARNALQAVHAETGANVELTVFSVSPNQSAALQPLARLCKPYDSVERGVAGLPVQGRLRRLAGAVDGPRSRKCDAVLRSSRRLAHPHWRFNGAGFGTGR